jgi:integrase
VDTSTSTTSARATGIQRSTLQGSHDAAAAGIARRGPYCLRHSFATEALAAGISTFELSRLMGSSLEMIERTYGHLAHDL